MCVDYVITESSDQLRDVFILLRIARCRLKRDLDRHCPLAILQEL